MDGEFKYSGGVFSPKDLGLDEADDKALRKLGLYKSQIFGDETGAHFVLYERTRCQDRLVDFEWLVEFNTAGVCCYIAVDNWPDLIGLLSQLSNIAILGSFCSDDHEHETPYLRVKFGEEFRGQRS